MAFYLSKHSLSPPSSAFQTPPKLHLTPLSPHLNLTPFIKHTTATKPPLQNHLSFISIIPKAIQESDNNQTTNLNNDEKNIKEEGLVDTESATELGEQIKKAMKEREEKAGRDMWSGVAEEIREIEWPPFSKVLGTTGVVLGVIAGSSVVLLTVNAVLAQLSDTVFAGKGVQDFFS
ncbi:hypothetical protein LIER_07725 [Lithospermum erythrorhizon]|uniref:Preprotein translocase subunit SECE1 n=1 Tax=Lithospermum erythrorhizon TaxID=34254 RepID=A0AAV3PDI6_LITER